MEKQHLETARIEFWATLEQIFKKKDGGKGLDYLLQDDDMWQSIANMVKLWV
jgi:hypothetical protein